MYINVNSSKLYYEKTGSGRALIMLHGNGESHEIFYEAAKILSKHFTVYLPDARGHGKSVKASEYHYEDMAEDMRCFIEETGIVSPVFYGFSDGGIVGLLLACRYPELLDSLFVSGANLSPNGIKTKYRLLFKAVYLLKRDPKYKMMLTEPDITKEMLENIKFPVFISAGGNDIIKPEETLYLADCVPNSRLRIFPGENHMSYVVKSDKAALWLIENYIGIKHK